MAVRTSEDQADPPTVLVVEDEVLIRMSTADYLRGCGYHIIEVGSGDEAVAVLKTDVRIDVVFTDVSMPGNLNGFGLAQWVRSERPGVRVILTSGVPEPPRKPRISVRMARLWRSHTSTAKWTGASRHFSRAADCGPRHFVGDAPLLNCWPAPSSR